MLVHAIRKDILSFANGFALLALVLVLGLSFFQIYQSQQRTLVAVEAALSSSSGLPDNSQHFVSDNFDIVAIKYQQQQTIFNAQAVLTRKVTLAESDAQVTFIHPVVVMLSSPVIWSFTALYLALAFYIRKRLLNTLNKQFGIITNIEHWADQTHVQGIGQTIQGEHNIVAAINHVQDALSQANNNDSQFDHMIRERALLDHETGIGNREYFSNRLEALLREEDIRGAVLLIQLKECELIKTLYGKVQAINLVKSVIATTKHRLKNFANYFIARRSDFEIAILVPGLYVKETEKLTDRLLKNLQTIPLPVGINKEEFIHIGISCFNDEQKAYKIMAEADMALRSAQLQGPSQWFMFDPGEVANETAKGSLRWRTFLSSAIEHNAFVIFFQPVIAADSDQILHHEVLTKVRDKAGSLINARVFLPMAKKCGLSVEIDLLVFEHICRLLSYEKRQNDDCSINLSTDALLSPQFMQAFYQKLDQFPAVASHLIIEISEYQLVSHQAELLPVLNRLSHRGVKILADKVGQYVVNANYIKQAPISFIKLHRSIVLGIHEKPENQVFIQSIKNMCEREQVSMYALGVESFEEWRALVKLGVSGGQGHFFTEPVELVAKAIGLP